MTLAEIKENNLRCVIKVDSKEEAVKLFEIFSPNGYDANYVYDYLMDDYWKGDGTVCCGVTDNKINGFDTETYYKRNEEQYGKIYRFKDLIAKEGIVGTFKGTSVYATGGVVSIHDLPTSVWYNPVRPDLPEFVFDAEQAKNIAERLAKELNGMLGVSFIKKEEKKMLTKFTFYTVDTSRINKTNNTKVDTIMTCVHIGDKVGYATCDKEDYDEREGILNAIANLCCDGSFDKAYRKAVKEKKISETLDCTCSYCRKVFDTVEKRQEHEAWHIECRKARHQRYLLRKRAKEIAFEEAAQKMAKEMIAEDNKK